MTQATIDADAPAPAPAGRSDSLSTAAGVAFLVLVGLVSALTLFYLSSPSGELLLALALLFAWLVLGLTWVVWALVELVLGIRARSFRRRRWQWLVASALVVVVTAALVVTSLPLKARFALSESRLDDAVSDVLLVPVTGTAPTAQDAESTRLGSRCVALFCFDSIAVVGDDVYFSSSSGIFGEAGFAYSDDGYPVPNDGGTGGSGWTFEELGDGWYSFYVSD